MAICIYIQLGIIRCTSSPFKGRSKYDAKIRKINQISSISTENHKKRMERNFLSYTPFIWI